MLLSIKLKNLIKECPASNGIDFDFYLKNIVINGQKRGCSGFIVNKKNGNIVYINTEKPVYGGAKRYLYRYADSINDYRGQMNRFCNKPEDLAENICLLLSKDISQK